MDRSPTLFDPSTTGSHLPPPSAPPPPPATDPDHLPPVSGQRLGRYELQRRIAVGGMAEIYRGRTVSPANFEKQVVVKRILPQHALDPDVLRMFLDEARLMARLGHPNIPQVYDVAEHVEVPYFAMEYVPGPDLRRVLSARPGQPLPIAEAVAIGLGVAAGLHHAHEQHGSNGEPLGIVHRDVSPSNVLISLEGAVKVTDFGIAKWAQQRSLTHQGQLKGKLAHLSPEQCRGAAVDRRSDVFALGILLYEMTTGRLPFEADNEYNLLRSIMNDAPPTPERADGYPEGLRQIVLRALAREPAQRYPTALALQSDLERFAHDAHLRLSPIAVATLLDRRLGAQADEWRDLNPAAAARRDPVGSLSGAGAEPPMAPAERTLTEAGRPSSAEARPRDRKPGADSAPRVPRAPRKPRERRVASRGRLVRRIGATAAAGVGMIAAAIAIARLAPAERARPAIQSGEGETQRWERSASPPPVSPAQTQAHRLASSAAAANPPEHAPAQTEKARNDRAAARPRTGRRAIAAAAPGTAARAAARTARVSALTAHLVEPSAPTDATGAVHTSERAATASQPTRSSQTSAPLPGGPAVKVWDPDSPVLPE